MYTTLHLKNVLKKENNRKPWIKFRVLLKKNLQLKMIVSGLSNSKRVAKKIVKPSTLWNNNFVNILK